MCFSCSTAVEIEPWTVHWGVEFSKWQQNSRTTRQVTTCPVPPHQKNQRNTHWCRPDSIRIWMARLELNPSTNYLWHLTVSHSAVARVHQSSDPSTSGQSSFQAANYNALPHHRFSQYRFDIMLEENLSRMFGYEICGIGKSYQSHYSELEIHLNDIFKLNQHTKHNHHLHCS